MNYAVAGGSDQALPPAETPLQDVPVFLTAPTWGRRALVMAMALGGLGSGTLSGCASVAGPAAVEADDLALANRLSWGVDSATLQALHRMGRRDYIAAQLHPPAEAQLPPAVQARIAALPLQQRSMEDWVGELAQRRSAAQALSDDQDKRAALQSYQRDMNALAQDAATRTLLRAHASPHQLQEQMGWFWFNHFNVFQGKADLRAMVGDYQERLRPLALGRFRDLLVASATHAAMLRYLDNAQNAARRRNENYARELMELHTLGAAGGYTQKDVQELARVLTGLGVRFGNAGPPPLAPALQALYWRQGAVEFHPGRHDMGEKHVLGTRIPAGQGWSEVLDQLGRLARHPATAQHVCLRMAHYLGGDQPAPALVARMVDAFTASDGSIALTLQTLFDAPEFGATLGRKFKDPMHYLVSALRMLRDGQDLLDTRALLTALDRMGQGLYKHQTPDGYPLDAVAWSGSGQMSTRFELAQTLVGRAGNGMATPAQLAIEAGLDRRTRRTLDAASSPQERQMLLLCSPPFQYR